MNEKTRQISKVLINNNILNYAVQKEYEKNIYNIVSKKYAETEKNFFSQKWVAFTLNGEKGYWNKDTEYAIPVKTHYREINDSYFGIKTSPLNFQAMEIMFDDNCPEEILLGIKSSKSFKKGHWIGFDDGSYCIETGQYSDWNDGESVQIGSVKIKTSDFKSAIISGEYQIASDDNFKKIIRIMLNGNVKRDKDNIISMAQSDFNKLVVALGINQNSVIKDSANKLLSNFTLTPEIISAYKNDLLLCDKKRADIEKYDDVCLEDINAGHWEIWSDGEIKAEKGQILASIPKPLIARNPVADIHEDGLIGIDFGTKSTIVSKQNGRNKATLLRVGIGQLRKAAEAYHYENPTVMEFINLDKFISDYSKKSGRPDTSIDDLRVSHMAENDLKSSGISDSFYSYFYDIKQWCGEKNRKVKITDQTKKECEKIKEWELEDFVKLKEGDFNPLEIYAYYLGLYINNMRNGIYLNYTLSFPVTYSKEVKDKILDSFKSGIKKSLPETVLRNKEKMSMFRVRQGVSEPAAYAITALQEYGFEPEEDEKVMYAIFDFGGGTTDFDFGVWRQSDERIREEEPYDWVIEHFGSEGDRYLGGENLLELMAYEVFKANAKILLQPQKMNKKNSDGVEEPALGITFSKPVDGEDFADQDTLVADTQVARRNTKQLMEALRPFWEGITGIAGDTKTTETKASKTEIEYNGYIFKNTEDSKFPVEDGIITVDLFDKEGKRKANQKLYIDNPNEGIKVDLIDVLEKRIEIGVKNFFQAIVTAFRNKAAAESEVNEIQIFLAGNASKSPVLHKLLNNYISSANERYRKNGIDGDFFKLYPPLGTKEAHEIQKKRGVKVDINDVSTPTGKTGVAYGLISGREGGRIKVVSEITPEKEIKFRYYIAIERRGKFKVILDRNKVDYGKWIRLGVARSDFEFYYSTLPAIYDMSPDEDSVPLKHCYAENVNPDSDIYIRAVGPNKLEYCIVDKDSEPDDKDNTVTICLED
ncbi:MAG: hypothetical protein PUE12_09010 [Oscillospiraceae bacterium]|nr:hypothetical protein [Oscillospiraceae bacterium]